MRLLCLLCHRAEWLACVFFFFFLLPVPVPCEVVQPSTNQPQCHLLQVLLHHSSAPRLATSCAQRVFHLAAKLGGAWFSGSSPPPQLFPTDVHGLINLFVNRKLEKKALWGFCPGLPEKGKLPQCPFVTTAGTNSGPVNVTI